MAQVSNYQKKKLLDQNIKVVVRVRPLNQEEIQKKIKDIVNCISHHEIRVKDKSFYYDNIFSYKHSQFDVYSSVVGPMIHDVIQGYNCTVFVYGQTGTGKTYTMTGGENLSKSFLNWKEDESAGCIPRAGANIFEELGAMQMKEFNVKVSFIELYNEEVRDLLNDEDKSQQLNLFNDSKGSVYVQGLTEQTVITSNDINTLLRKGTLKRQTASTLMNRHSSRSHTVFTITVNTRETTVDGVEILKSGKLYLVDLAGSENIGRSGAKDKRALESANINRSLLTLGRIIHILADKNSKYVPYRDSKLTRILQDSLGGHSKTSIIATVSPAHTSLEETLSTLEYASRARDIKNTPMINEKVSKSEMMNELNQEISKLRRDLEEARSGEGFFLSKETWAEWQDKLNNSTNLIELKDVVIQEMKKKLSDLETVRGLKEKQYEEAMEACKRRENIISKAKLYIQQERFVSDCYLQTVNEEKQQKRELLDISKGLSRDKEVLRTKLENQYYTNCSNVDTVQKKSAALGANFSDFQDAVARLESDLPRVVGEFDRRIGSVQERNSEFVQDSMQNTQLKFQSLLSGVQTGLGSVESKMENELKPHIRHTIAKVKNVFQACKDASVQLDQYNAIGWNTRNTIGDLCQTLTNQLLKVKSRNDAFLGTLDIIREATKAENTDVDSMLLTVASLKSATGNLDELQNHRERVQHNMLRVTGEQSDSVTDDLESMNQTTEQLAAMLVDVKRKCAEEVEQAKEEAESCAEQFVSRQVADFAPLIKDARELTSSIHRNLDEFKSFLSASERLRMDLEKEIVPVVRAGDTPTVKPLQYPKRLDEEVPPRRALIKKFKQQHSERSENISINLDGSGDSSIQPLDDSNDNNQEPESA